MPRKPAHKSTTLPFKAGTRDKSLIEWDDPSRQAHVLDWRQRAHGFGLDVDEREDADGDSAFVSPTRLLEDDEPEAFTEQSFVEEEPAEPAEEEEEAAAEPGASTSRDDIDLVRVYLQHIGKRRLLKAHEEQ